MTDIYTDFPSMRMLNPLFWYIYICRYMSAYLVRVHALYPGGSGKCDWPGQKLFPHDLVHHKYYNNEDGKPQIHGAWC